MAETLKVRLKRAREMAGLSARALSSLAGLTPSHVSLIEAGQPGIESKTAMKLAGVLGVSLDWLLTGKGEPPTAEAVKSAVERATKSAA
jgi:transcriptional regulator with XRE-family HTH domain